jgi:hypothetical protein
VSTETPFVAQLRARPETIRLGTAGAPVITVRVQVPEVWDTVRIDAPPDTPVLTLKERALETLMSGADQAEFVTKLRGFEVLDETASLSAAGALNGSTLLVTSRRRRPVR